MPQYDVENRFSYYKSYSDNILVGNPKPAIGDTTWDRVVSGSVVSGSEEYKAATILSDYEYKKANRFYKSGEVRYVRLQSSTQTIEDSLTPDIFSLYLTGSASGSIGFDLKYRNQLIAALYFATDGFAITSSAGTLGQRVNNTDFCFSSPYEKKYSYVKRQRPENYTVNNVTVVFSGSGVLNTTFDFSNIIGNNILNAPDAYSLSVICLTKSGSLYNSQNVVLDYYGDFSGSYNGTTFIIPAGQNGNSFIDKSLSKKLIFGIKPSPISASLSSSTTPNLQSYLPVYCTGSIIEGWKYGLYNGVPTNFSCVFRQNKYGQFRDMLEGRFYTQTYNNPAAGGPLDSGIAFISGSALAGESDEWLSASIYNGTNVQAAYDVNPYGSGIYDSYYRASQPWFDNDPRAK